MKVFKHIETGNLYCIVELNGSKTAIPLKNGGIDTTEISPIVNCDVSKFVPVADSPRIHSHISRGF